MSSPVYVFPPRPLPPSSESAGGFSWLSSSRSGSGGPTVRNIASAEAWKEITFGATPPSMRPRF